MKRELVSGTAGALPVKGDLASSSGEKPFCSSLGAGGTIWTSLSGEDGMETGGAISSAGTVRAKKNGLGCRVMAESLSLVTCVGLVVGTFSDSSSPL